MFKKERCSENLNPNATFDGMETMNMNMNMDFSSYGMPLNNCCGMDMCTPTMCPPIYECPQERVCHRTINYEVPQV